MDCTFVLEGENTPIELERYLKQKFEGRNIVFAVCLLGKTQYYSAKWKCYSKQHRLAATPIIDDVPSVHFVPVTLRRTTLYKVVSR